MEIKKDDKETLAKSFYDFQSDKNLLDKISIYLDETEKELKLINKNVK